jgi:hypothetical protein
LLSLLQLQPLLFLLSSRRDLLLFLALAFIFFQISRQNACQVPKTPKSSGNKSLDAHASGRQSRAAAPGQQIHILNQLFTVL